jgi:hypothetical protein
MPSLANVALRPSTIYRDTLPPSEKVKHKVCTVWPDPVVIPHAAFGTHCHIPGRPATGAPAQDGARSNRYGFALCPPGIEREDLGETKTLAMLSIASYRVAMDVIGLSIEGHDEIPGQDGRMVPIFAPAVKTSALFEKGYFVPVGDEPTEEELNAAEARRDAWFKNAIEKGDRAWNQTGKLDRIHPDSILAARYLGVEREWAPKFVVTKTQKKEIDCPCCTAKMPAGAKKCLTCLELIGYEADGRAFFYNDPTRKAASPEPSIDDELARIRARGRTEKDPE